MNTLDSTKTSEVARESTPSPIKIATWAHGKKISFPGTDSMSMLMENDTRASF